jgi:hypothetical protein
MNILNDEIDSISMLLKYKNLINNKWLKYRPA